jgi:hypothetical protein
MKNLVVLKCPQISGAFMATKVRHNCPALKVKIERHKRVKMIWDLEG